MKRYFIYVLYSLAYYSGLINLIYFFNRRPLVLTYHNILDDEVYDSARHLTVTHKSSVFERQLLILKEKFQIGSELKPGQVVITFDDAYKNNLSVALPIMQKHGVHATFFAPAVYFETSEMLWVDKILLWLAEVPAGTYCICGKMVTIEGLSDREAALKSIWIFLMDDFSIRHQVLQDMEDAYGFARLDVDRAYFEQRFMPMSREDIDLLIKTGHRVACHSYSHSILSRLSDLELETEFQKCSEYKHLYNSDWFGYPFGRKGEIDLRVVEKCNAAGFTKAFVNVESDIQLACSESFRLPRMNMPNTDSKALIHARLSGLEAFLKRLF